MGTRGTYGFFREPDNEQLSNGFDGNKLTYNHYDSYPEGLGRTIVEFIRNSTIKELNEIYDRIILVSSDEAPTPEQIAECQIFHDNTVSTGRPTEWYSLLRRAQGEPGYFKSGLRYMENSRYFIKDSLFCEWGYVINLSTNRLEIYDGYQHKPDPNLANRYRSENPTYISGDNKYYPCRLVIEFPLDNIPDDWLEQIINLTHREDD